MAGTIEAAAELLREARTILFVTGAGLSADSGLPTYRGIGGLYERERTEEGLAIEEVLSGDTLARDPALCWKYLREIGLALRGARPNAGHHVIAAFERERERVWVLTQNVDGLHRAAGSRQVIEIHGNASELHCTRCLQRVRTCDYETIEVPPACATCGALVRPSVVLFEEMLPAPALSTLGRELGRGFDVVVSVGTSSLFPYIVEPVLLARQQGLPTIEINPAETSVSRLVDVRVRLGAAEALAAIGRACLGSEAFE